MNPEFVQNVRDKLQQRVQRLQSAGYTTYHNVLQHFWGYLQESSLFSAILEELRCRVPDAKALADRKMRSNDFTVNDETAYAAFVHGSSNIVPTKWTLYRKCASGMR